MVKIFINLKKKKKNLIKRNQPSLSILPLAHISPGPCRSPHPLSHPSPTKISAVKASQSLFSWGFPQPFLLESNGGLSSMAV